MSGGEERRIRLGGEELPYRVDRGRRKYLYLCVGPQGVTVKAGMRTSVREIEAALKSKERWVLKKLKETERRRGPALREGELFPVLGEYFPLRFCPGTKRAEAVLREGTLWVSLPPGGGEAEASRALEGFYRRTAQEAAKKSLQRMCGLTGLAPKEAKVKKLSASWGRCSADEKISLSLRLAACPEPVIDYVVLHELCHLREMNHSAAFWALVERFMPDWRDRRERLRKMPRSGQP